MTPDKILIIRAQIKTGFSILLQIILNRAGCSDILFWLFLGYKNVFLKDETYYLPNNLFSLLKRRTSIRVFANIGIEKKMRKSTVGFPVK